MEIGGGEGGWGQFVCRCNERPTCCTQCLSTQNKMDDGYAIIAMIMQ